MIIAMVLIAGSCLYAGFIVGAAVLIGRRQIGTAEDFLRRDREVPKEISRRAL